VADALAVPRAGALAMLLMILFISIVSSSPTIA
jgi:hypothetical protein